MNVFLAGIMQGSIPAARIHPQDWRTPIKHALARHCPLAKVYCHYEAHPNSLQYEQPQIVQTLEDGNHRAREADVVICWLPEASMGTAIEMYVAAKAGAVVISITPMVANWVIRTYSDRILPDLDAFEQFLAGGELAALHRQKRLGGSGEPPIDPPDQSA